MPAAPAAPPSGAAPVDRSQNTPPPTVDSDVVDPSNVPRLREALKSLEAIVGQSLATDIDAEQSLVENWIQEIKEHGKGDYLKKIGTIWEPQKTLFLSVDSILIPASNKFPNLFRLPPRTFMNDLMPRMNRFISTINVAVTPQSIDDPNVQSLMFTGMRETKDSLIDFSTWQYGTQARIDALKKANGIK